MRHTGTRVSKKEGNQPTSTGIFSLLPGLHVSCCALLSLPWWIEIRAFAPKLKTFFISCARYFNTSVRMARVGSREGRLFLWLPCRMVRSICNGSWERFRMPQKSRLGTPCNTLSKALMEDSAESSEHQNVDNSVDSEDHPWHFWWFGTKTLLGIWQVNICVKLGQRTFLLYSLSLSWDHSWAEFKDNELMKLAKETSKAHSI